MKGQVVDYDSLVPLSAPDLREVFRQGKWTGSTGGLATENLQANLVILPLELAEDFEEFCRLNPQPCPLVDVSQPGSSHFSITPEANFYTDLPRYRVLSKGVEVDSPTDVSHLKTDDSVGFLLGCSVT